MNTIMKIGQMLRNKEISCVELTQGCLAEAKELNPELNAYICITEETALQAAAEVDAKIGNGDELPQLAGVPFVLQDSIVTAGLETTCASKMLENHVPLFDASVWEYLKTQNAVLIGKGNMDELGMGSAGETSYYGRTRNPCNNAYPAGGSACGVAAAVASGIAAFGVGADTGGGIRQSASYCGLVGLKPTYGAVSRNGLVALASSFDQIGPIAATAMDAAAVFDAICLKDGRDAMSKGRQPVSASIRKEINGMRVGVAKEFYEGLSPSVGKAMQNALKTFEEMGAVIVDAEFPLLNHSLSAYYIIACAEAASNLGCFDGLRCGYRAEQYDDIDDFICRTRSGGFGPEARRRIILGTCALSAEHYEAYYVKASKLANAVKNEFKRIFNHCDCLVAPTVSKAPMKLGAGESGADGYQVDSLTAPVNIAGLPAVSLPCGFEDNKLPIGMQIIGDKFREDVILSIAHAFETETEGA